MPRRTPRRQRRSRPRSKRSPRRPPLRNHRRTSRPSLRRSRDGMRFKLSANAIDLESILGELESPPAVAHASARERGSRPQHRARRPQTAFEPARAVGCRSAFGADAGRHRRGFCAPARRCAVGDAGSRAAVQARAGAARGRRHRRLHHCAAGRIPGAEAAVRVGIYSRQDFPRSRDDAQGRGMVRAGRPGAGARHRRKATTCSTTWPTPSRSKAKRHARSRFHWSCRPTRVTSVTWPSASIV